MSMEGATIDLNKSLVVDTDQLNQSSSSKKSVQDEKNVKDKENNEHGVCTPEQGIKTIDNSIFNTISKIVNQAAKVSILT